MSTTEATSTQVLYPCLRYQDAPAALLWLRDAFGAEEQLVVPAEKGMIAHAQLSIGGAVVMVGSQREDELGLKTPKQLGAGSGCIYGYTADVDGHFARAKRAGATVVYGPRDTDYGSREYGVRDPEGHFWSFGNYRP